MSLIKRCPDCEKPVEVSADACTHCGADLKWAQRGNIWLKLQERFSQAATRYEIDRLIGYGGMAGVYLAWDKKLGRSVALKLIQPAVAVDPRMVRRFFQEAQTMAQLGHEHIVQIYDMDERDDLVWMSMQYVPGRTLGEVLSDSGEPLPSDLVCTWLSSIASALAHAHDRATPVIHRDVKPSNILLNENGKALLTDFGIAKLQGESGLTRTSHLIGTPAYMSPEQCLGGNLGPASDQYSLGTVAFELLAGVPPFKGPTLVVLQSHRDMTAPDILEYRPDLPAGLAEVVRRMLAKDPEERWPTMNEAAEQFRKQIRNPVPPRILAAWSKRVHSIAISAQPDHLTLGTSEKLIAQALDHEGRALDGRRVRWSSTDERVAFVSPDGIVAGLGVGSAVIVAETGKAMTTVELKVSEPTVHHVTVSPPTLEMPAGETRQLVVTCFSRAGDTVAANPFFEVDRPDIVGVSSEGAVTGLEAGEASVTVRVAGQHETVEVRVVAAPIRTILILSSDLALALGQSARLPVETRGSDGRLQTDAALWWTSSDESVVAVSGTGVVRALGLGRATITASAGTASATLEIEVLRDEASVHTEPIGRTRPVDPGSPKGKEASTHLGATLLFDSQEFSTEKGTVPPAPREPSGEPPPGATVVFDGPRPDPSEGSQGWSEEQSQRAGAPGSYASAGDASKPSSHRPRQTGFSLGRKDAMAVGIGLAGAAVLFAIVSLWPSSRPEPVPVAVSAVPRDTMVRVGQEFQYRLDAEGAGAGAEIDGRWRTSDASVVLVSRTGVARAVGVGSAVVSLMGEGLPRGAIQAVVTVVPLDPPGSLTILGPGEVTVGGQPWQYRLQAPSGSTLEDPETAWVVEPGSLASVSPNGQLFARAAGTVELSAALNGRTASTRVRITAPPTPTPPRTDDRPRPFDIRIAGAPTGPVEVGSTISLEARLLDEDQRTMAGDLSWASLNPGALSQTGPSSFQAVAAGVATLEVTAGLSNLSRSITVTIVPRVVEVNPTEASGVTLNPQSVELVVGQSAQLSATAVNRAGGVIDNAPFEWTARNAGIARVSGPGTVVAVAAGTTFVLVDAGDVFDSTLVRVTEESVESVPTDADGRREAARYYAWFVDRDLASLAALIPAAESERHRAFLSLIEREWLEPDGPATGQRVDGNALTFSIPVRQRTNFGARQSRQLDFTCQLAQADGEWNISSCVLAPDSYVPGN